MNVQETKMPWEAAKKIIDLMVKHGAEQNATLSKIGRPVRKMSFSGTNR